MSYLNQNLEGRDIPPGQLLSEADFVCEVWSPDIHNGKPSVMFAPVGQPYPSRMYFDSFEEAQEWASSKSTSFRRFA